MHEVKVAHLYTLLVNRSASVIDCRKGQANCLKSEAHLKVNGTLSVPTRIREETVDFRVLRFGDPFDADHALSIKYKDFEYMQVIYIREDRVGKLLWDGIPKDQATSRLGALAWKVDIVREKHFLRTKKKIKNLTTTPVILSERVDSSVYTELVSIKPDEVGTLRYCDDRSRLEKTWYRIHVQGHAEEVSSEWRGTEFFADKDYISISEVDSQPQSLDVRSWPRTYKRIMNRASSKYSQLFRNS